MGAQGPNVLTALKTPELLNIFREMNAYSSLFQPKSASKERMTKPFSNAVFYLFEHEHGRGGISLKLEVSNSSINL